jgi:DNA-directed RNA polymerase specialized sigma subunit
MRRYDYDERFQEQWQEAAWDDATEELTSTLKREPTDQEIEDACRAARIHDHIAGLPEKWSLAL